ncbi:MAG: polyprenyl synthetase family protein, partial [Bacteroidota bacterium]
LKIINNKNKTQVNIDRVIDFVRLNHGIEYSIDKMEDYKNQAIAILNKYPENEAQKALIKLVEFVITRNK